MVGCPLAAAAVLSCKVLSDRWIAPILLSGRWTCRVTQPVQRTPPYLLLGCLLLTRVGGPSRLRFRGSGRFMMSVFSFLSRQDAIWLDESPDAGDVSRAWLVWSCAAETALVDAYRFSGGPIPGRGLVLGRRSAFPGLHRNSQW